MNKKIQEQFIQKITGLSKEKLFLNKPTLSSQQQEELEDYISRYEDGEPIEYILEKAEFYGLDFFVDKRVLIPRNDTEIMVEKALEEIIKQKNSTLIDMGTGSGCIAISILENLKKQKKSRKLRNCFAVDFYDGPLEVSKINVENFKSGNKILPVKSNLLDAFNKTNFFNIERDLIITANLPYINEQDYASMDRSIVDYEPFQAFYGGESTGFFLYNIFLNQCFEFMNNFYTENMIVFIEIGFNQKQVCKTFLEEMGLYFEFFKDNNGLERCVKIKFENTYWR